MPTKLGSRGSNKTTPSESSNKVVELEKILSFIKSAIVETNKDKRRQIIGAALLRFGLKFFLTLDNIPLDRTKALADLTWEVLTQWLDGNSLTDRKDEDELRAAVAIDFIDFAKGEVIYYIAKALLLIPPEHLLRKSAAMKLIDRVRQTREAGELNDYIILTETALITNLLAEPDALTIADDLLQLAEKSKVGEHAFELDHRRRALIAVSAWHMYRAIDHRDSNLDAAVNHRKASDKIFDKARALGVDDKWLMIKAVNFDESGMRMEAADLLSVVKDRKEADWMEGRMRFDLGDYERSAELLKRVVLTAEKTYFQAIGEKEVLTSGKKYTESTVHLAFAYAFLNRWEEALHYLDMTRSPRIRHKMKLRQSTNGSELLKLEARLAADSRGVPYIGDPGIEREKDPMGYRLAATVRALERYRNKRPELEHACISSPTIADVGNTLAVEEAVVSLGSGAKGLMIIIIMKGDSEQPGGAFIVKELRGTTFDMLFAVWDTLIEWPHKLRPASFKHKELDPKSTLEEFLYMVDKALGVRVSTFLRDHGVRQVTIIPHLELHVVPFWALPSFKRLDVRTAPSLAQWFQARERVSVLTQDMISVGNPTLDLGLATVEAEVVKILLSKRDCKTVVLVESAAKEDAIRNSMRNKSLLHFAGHGKARSTDPLLSALLTHPDERWGWPVSGDPLAAIAASVTRWRNTDEVARYADVNEGRLIEEYGKNGVLYQRRLEHTSKGTLWGQYDGEELLQLAELWTTSDILIETVFVNCSVAYLSACETGRVAFRTVIDEDVGLSSALQIAGVDTVVCTLWPVGSVVAFIFSILFYRKLVEQQGDTVDLAAIVAECREELATLNKKKVVDVLRETKTQIAGRVSRAHIEYVIKEINQGPDKPYKHPYHWAAFFTQGVERVKLEW